MPSVRGPHPIPFTKAEMAGLLDHLDGAGEQRRWDGQTEGLVSNWREPGRAPRADEASWC